MPSKVAYLVPQTSVNEDWITDEQYTKAYQQAEEIAKSFWKNTGDGEETWDEIWVDDVAFDLNCWEEEYEGGDTRTSPVHVSLYPTYETENGLRDTVVDECVRLFTINP